MLDSALLAAIALGYLAGAAEWLRTARSAWQRAGGLEHQGRPAEQWRTLAAKDALGSLLFVGLAVISAAETAEGRLSAADPFLVMGVVPMVASLRLGRRFERMSDTVAAIEDLAQRNLERAAHRDVFVDSFAERLAGVDVGEVPGISVRSLYEPVEGALGGDFVGVAAVGSRLDLVVGDVTGHGFDAALEAMRLKDLLLAELRADQSPARALAVANAFLYSETPSEAFATAFVAQYDDGVVVYANAGHPPALVVGEKAEAALAPTGPLLGVTQSPLFEQAEVLVAPGERLLVFTDGLVEAYGPAASLKADEIADLLRTGGIEALHATVHMARHEPVRDDIALVELWRLPTAVAAAAPSLEPEVTSTNAQPAPGARSPSRLARSLRRSAIRGTRE